MPKQGNTFIGGKTEKQVTNGPKTLCHPSWFICFTAQFPPGHSSAGPSDAPEFLLCDPPPHRQACGSALKKAGSSTEAGPPTPCADSQKLSHMIARLGETGDPQVQTLGSTHH